jgi:arylsulfatase A-like enzyme
MNHIRTAFLYLALALPAFSKPNIIFIVGDDMGYADVGFHGCKDIPTPHLDALAASGVKFTNGYVSGPYCSPTRAGLMTGRYQTKFGHEFNPGRGGAGLPLTETALPARLKAAGYKTGMVGKWHLGSDTGMHPVERGFDEFFGFLAGAHDYFPKNGILRGKEPVKVDGYLTDAFGNEAAEFISRHQTEPFFLYLAFNAVHTPMQADEARLAKFASIPNKQRRTYAAMMTAMDDAVGRVRGKLTEAGIDKNTLITFISDNGGPTMAGVTVNGSINAPLRGSKRTTMEGGVRVPFLMSWPAKLQPGVYEKPVIQMDLTATALKASEQELDPAWKLDGVDLLPFLTGANAAAPHEALYWRFGTQMAIRSGDFKLVRYDNNVDETGAKGVTPARLYNLAEDIGEKKDLADEKPEKLAELQAKWDAWNATLMPPLWGNGKGEDTPKKKGKGKKKRGA